MRFEIDVPIPLKMSLNDRPNRWQKARQTRALRELAAWRAKSLRIGPQVERVDVGLVWTVTTAHRRDEENLVATLKPLCDGLVDAGVVPDDTPQFMRKLMPEIVRGEKPALTFWIHTFDQYGEDAA